MLPAGALKTLCQQLRPGALPGETVMPAAVVISAAVDTAQHRHHLGATFRIVLFQPLVPQRADLIRETQYHISRRASTGLRRLCDDILQLMIVDERNQRRHQHRHRHPGAGQLTDRPDPFPAGAGARLQLVLQAVVQRGHGYRHRGPPLPRHRRDQIQVAQHQAAFGDQAERVPAFAEHLQNLPGDAPFALDRLVGVGGGADHQGRTAIGGFAQCFPQHFGGVVLAEDLALEILPWGQVHIGMVGARETVDATMLTTPVRVQAGREMNIRTVVAGNDRARPFRVVAGGPGRFRFIADGGGNLEAPRRCAEGSAVGCAVCHSRSRILSIRTVS